MTPRLPLFVLVVAVLSLAVVSCGGNDEAVTRDESAGESPEAQTGHIHGLGVDPDDGTLFIATHHGLFAAEEGEVAVERVSESTQDFMGFSIASEDRFIGSGHPPPEQQDLPPNLGMIESTDGGRTWENVSLLGEADFHVLRAQGDRIYGFDGTQGRLMVSRDGGQSWQQRTPPAGVYDLAIDPEDPDRVIASTEQGVFVSTDAANRWRPGNNELAGLLAWPAPDRLYLVSGQGEVLRSRDGGREFEPVGQVNGQPVAFMADNGELYVALSDGSVQRSDDGGASWTQRATT